MDKINTIVRKEWAEVFRNRLVLFTVAFLPLILTALPLGILYSTRSTGAEQVVADMPAQFSRICPTGLSSGECFQVYMVSQFMILFMMLPLAIPVTIAAYSIVGEKTTHSLEPLLATPISTIELLAAKSLAAVIPAVGATWTGFLIYAIGARLILSNPRVYAALIDPLWLIAVIVVGPLLAILAVSASVMVSSRVNDPRVAEQLSMIVIVPVLGLFFGQISGLFFLNQQAILIIALVLSLIDLGMLYLAVQLFQRETILTRWK